MGFINMLKISPESGAMVCDEESWYLRMRRTFHTVPLFFLVEPDYAAKHGLDAVYAGIGTPNYQAELARRVRGRIAERAGSKRPVAELDEVGRILADEMNGLTRWWTDNALRFTFGFDLSDYERGYAEREGGKLEIGAEGVRKAVDGLVAGKRIPGQHKENHGLLMGYDAAHGFNAFNVKGEIGVLSQLSAGFEALGTGKYTACGVLAKYLNRHHLTKRRAGLDERRAVLELYRASAEAVTYVNESGGTLHFVYLDRENRRRVHVYHHRSKLAEETARLFDAGELAECAALDLLDLALFKNAPVDAAEEALFSACKDPARARLLLRGYKDDETLREVPPEDDEKPAPRRARGKRGA